MPRCYGSLLSRVGGGRGSQVCAVQYRETQTVPSGSSNNLLLILHQPFSISHLVVLCQKDYYSFFSCFRSILGPGWPGRRLTAGMVSPSNSCGSSWRTAGWRASRRSGPGVGGGAGWGGGASTKHVLSQRVAIEKHASALSVSLRDARSSLHARSRSLRCAHTLTAVAWL